VRGGDEVVGAELGRGRGTDEWERFESGRLCGRLGRTFRQPANADAPLCSARRSADGPVTVLQDELSKATRGGRSMRSIPSASGETPTAGNGAGAAALVAMACAQGGRHEARLWQGSGKAWYAL
jgi:hypothetical protein